MLIPNIMNNKISSIFYDKYIYIHEVTVSTDADGCVKRNISHTSTNYFKGNVNTSNCKLLQEEYGCDYQIDISITTNSTQPKINDVINYNNTYYIITDCIKFDSHILILAKYVN